MQWWEYNGRLLETTSQIELGLSRGNQIIAPAVNTFQIHRKKPYFYVSPSVVELQSTNTPDSQVSNWKWLQNTTLGWVFGGRTRDSTNKHITTCHLSVFEQLDHQLKEFWGRSTVGLTPCITWGSRLHHLSESCNELKLQFTLLPLFPNPDSCIS